MLNLRQLSCTAVLGMVLAAGPASSEPRGGDAAVPDPPGAEARDKMTVCTDGQSHYVALMLRGNHYPDRIYYGDGKRFIEADRQQIEALTGGFLDPRFFSPHRNPDFRGVDHRFVSEVELKDGNKACAVRCGERRAEMSILDQKAAQDLMRAATFAPAPTKYDPHRLARDENGIYYYIDRGTGENSKQFRLFIGPRGNMKQLKLTNTVSDSEGDIFSTKTGSLRLVVGHHEGQWIEKGKRKGLVVVPIDDYREDWKNRQMIYQDLGVYTGDPLGTPCDMQLTLKNDAH